MGLFALEYSTLILYKDAHVSLTRVILKNYCTFYIILAGSVLIAVMEQIDYDGSSGKSIIVADS